MNVEKFEDKWTAKQQQDDGQRKSRWHGPVQSIPVSALFQAETVLSLAWLSSNDINRDKKGSVPVARTSCFNLESRFVPDFEVSIRVKAFGEAVHETSKKKGLK